MITFKKTLFAVAATLVAGAASASPVFEPGKNDLYFNNLENQYRSDASCAQVGGCLGTGTGPTGYQLADPTIAGNIVQGDIFAGVIRFQNIDHIDGSQWLQAGNDQFQGYFAQEVLTVGPVGTAAQITFQNLTVADPFGVLAAGEMMRLYVDNGATVFTSSTGGTVAGIIALATDGVFWGSLGLSAGNNGGYAYAIDDLTAAGNAPNTSTESFLAMNLVTAGAAYNAGQLNLINDFNESVEGGVSAGLICSAAEIANVAVQCTEYVGTSEIEFNTNSFLANGNSPFLFASNDPATISRIPEPATLSVLGLGLLGLAASRRRAAKA
ncbi:MAG: PEP-CTERM sorting domain-containing protein [Rhodocyclaceae bacterium]|nr:PEP-CTERM sorting domain-containing protein [Rhodocyclaceae bacterium]